MQKTGTVAGSKLYKKYVTRKGIVEAVKRILFNIDEGKFYALPAPSGCGKTTTLRGLAGFKQIDDGGIQIRAVHDRMIRPTAHPENLFSENTPVTTLFDAKQTCTPEEK